MSYEGYVQLLCEKGHYFTEDYYIFGLSEDDDWRCGVCGGHLAWWNCVDLTNGNYEDGIDSKRIDGYVELEIDQIPATCPTCGQTVEHPNYKIPKDVRMRVEK